MVRAGALRGSPAAGVGVGVNGRTSWRRRQHEGFGEQPSVEHSKSRARWYATKMSSHYLCNMIS
jgi:hypothetical protein